MLSAEPNCLEFHTFYIFSHFFSAENDFQIFFNYAIFLGLIRIYIFHLKSLVLHREGKNSA